MSSPAALLVVTGRATGIRYPLDRAETVIGRASASDVQLVDEAVSRSHARILETPQGYAIEDLGGKNGTIVNSLRIEGPTILRPGDAIAIGSTTFLFDPPIDFLTSNVGASVVVAEELPATRAGKLHEQLVTGRERGGPDAETLLALLSRSVGDSDEKRKRKDPVLEALELLRERFQAERAFVLVTAAGGRHKIRASSGNGLITVSRTIVQAVLEGKKAVISGDAAGDIAFGGGVSIVHAEIRSLLAAPLIVDGRVFGMIHLDRRTKDAYPKSELEVFVPAANLLALVVLAADSLDRLKKEASKGRASIDEPFIVAASPPMKKAIEEIDRAARSGATVLLEGETGTGKEVLARLLHLKSERRAGPFVALNCGALVEALEESELFGHEEGAFTGAHQKREGLFEAAAGGTLFLDEVGETAKSTQVKLLRALQERAIFRVGGTRAIEVDVRIVAASSRPLDELVATGRIREDLFYRLAVVRVRVPPLRERPEDVPALARAYVEKLCRDAGVPPKRLLPDAVEALASLRWPGNVRELKNAIERIVLLSEATELGRHDLPPDFVLGDIVRRATKNGETLAEVTGRVEREMIVRALARTGGVKSAAAEVLGISRVTLDSKLKAFGIEWKRAT
ncbi:MAG: sigma 54-interacting transcriptional regulator [Deltaproteobacteria bacterium]|nr:sigma 54-interacting transcriptional regulator [Deltaproteobacteria bacterium]